MDTTKINEYFPDIKFEINGFNFNVRSSCIIKDKLHRKVLLTNARAVTDHEAFLLPGGRLNLKENSKDAIAREIKEELGINLEYRLVSIEENIAKEKKLHMIEFVYYAEIEDFNGIKLDGDWDKFKIIDIADIENIDIRPKSIKELIKQNDYKNITHHINYDWL